MNPFCFSAFLAVAAAAVSMAATTGLKNWNYNGIHGPLSWSNQEKQCQGKSQSPVDLLSSIVTRPDKQPKEFVNSIKFSWPKLEGVTVSRQPNAVNFTPKSKAWIQVKGETYKLDSFHYHAPGEHRRDNQYADLEFHFVFKGSSKPSKILVVGFRFNVVRHHSHGFINDVVNGIPKSNKELTLRKVSIDDLAKSANGFKRIYTYTGSLTVPPCTEGVQWLIVENILDVSVDHLKTLREAIGFSSRPTTLGPNEPASKRY